MLFVAENCAVGPTEIYCKQPCSYPFYSSGCQQVWLCPKQRCDISTGCQSLKNRNCLHLSEPTCYLLLKWNSFNRHFVDRNNQSSVENISTKHGFVQMFVSTALSVTTSERKGKYIQTFRNRHISFFKSFFFFGIERKCSAKMYIEGHILFVNVPRLF